MRIIRKENCEKLPRIDIESDLRGGQRHALLLRRQDLLLDFRFPRTNINVLDEEREAEGDDTDRNTW